MNRDSALKNFQIISKLGEGSFSCVYKVQRRGDGILYAMKKVKIGQMREKEKENALNEVRILASISHPNIVDYREAFFDDESQTLCVVMELADAGDIQKRINTHLSNRSHFPQTDIWQAIIQMARGLQSLHSANILHRDLKCANVFCTLDGKYKLGDLNVSKVAKRGMARTQTGTPYYTSPQVWKDQPYDSKCDIWSLGCVVYEMAALKPPFRATNLKELYAKIQRGIFERIPTIYSDSLQKFIELCLKVHPHTRPSADEILNLPSVLARLPATDSHNHKSSQQKCNLLKTIHVPKNLRALKEALPKSKYDTSNTNQSELFPSKNENSQPIRKVNSYSQPKNEISPERFQQNRLYMRKMHPDKGYQEPVYQRLNNDGRADLKNPVQLFQRNQEVIIAKKYERANSAQQLNRAPSVKLMQNLPEKNGLGRRPSSSREKQRDNSKQVPQKQHQREQYYLLPKCENRLPVLPRMVRNNSVDAILKKNQPEAPKICLDDITNRCREIEERVQKLINKQPLKLIERANRIGSISRKLILPRVQSREVSRENSARGRPQVGVRQRSAERSVSSREYISQGERKDSIEKNNYHYRDPRQIK